MFKNLAKRKEHFSVEVQNFTWLLSYFLLHLLI